MAKRHRLRGLQVGEAGHRVGGVGGGSLGQSAHQSGDLCGDSVDRVAHPQPEVGRHLIVAAARGMQALAGFTDALGQPRLDVHVDIFKRGGKREQSGFDFRPYPLQAVAYRHHIRTADHPGLAKHGGMREGTLDVLAPEFPVEADGGVDILHDRSGPRGESPAPLLVGRRVPAV